MAKQSKVLRRQLARLATFRDGLVDILGLCEPVDEHFGTQVWQPKRGYDAEVTRRVAQLEHLTQAAAKTVQDVGVLVEFKPAGTMQTHAINPVLAWSTLFDRPVIEARLIVGSCERAIGAIEAEIEDAEMRESTAAGRLESKLDGPRSIWSALSGGPGEARAHPRAAWTGAVLGMVAAVMAGGILHWLGWS